MNKWRIAFLIFIITYTFFITLNLDYSAIQADEINHLTGGIALLHGNTQVYFNHNGFYPPLYDIVTMVFFGVTGPTVFTARLTSIFFSFLLIFAVFEFIYRIYGPMTALLSGILLGIMPGYVYLSRMAITETMLVFFLTVSLALFFNWLRTRQDKMLLFSGVSLGLGALTQYRILVAGLIMAVAFFFISKGHLKNRFKRFLSLIVIAGTITIPWFISTYQMYASGMLNRWLLAIEVGNTERLFYATGIDRLPYWFTQLPEIFRIPMFYSVELTIPWFDIHPITPIVYFLGLAGLGIFALRRKPEDEFMLIWFFAAYVFFTLIPNRQWRYMFPVFPVLAISAASFLVSIFNKIKNTWGSTSVNLQWKRATKMRAYALFTILLALSIYVSVSDSFYWIEKDQTQMPIEDAANYVTDCLTPDQSLMVICPQNLFNDDMIRFYLYRSGKNNSIWQYPELPIDAYTPNFNATELIDRCRQNNVKYIFVPEFEGALPYFDPTLSLDHISMMFNDPANSALSHTISAETTIGTAPNRIFILHFSG